MESDFSQEQCPLKVLLPSKGLSPGILLNLLQAKCLLSRVCMHESPVHPMTLNVVVTMPAFLLCEASLLHPSPLRHWSSVCPVKKTPPPSSTHHGIETWRGCDTGHGCPAMIRRTSPSLCDSGNQRLPQVTLVSPVSQTAAQSVHRKPRGLPVASECPDLGQAGSRLMLG